VYHSLKLSSKYDIAITITITITITMKEIITTEVQLKIWNRVSRDAGPRYTKELNVELSINDSFHAIGRTNKLFQEIDDLKKDVHKNFNYLDNEKDTECKNIKLVRKYNQIRRMGKAYLSRMDSFGVNKSKKINVDKIKNDSKKIQVHVDKLSNLIWDLERKIQEKNKSDEGSHTQTWANDSESVKIRDLNNRVRNFSSAIRSLSYFAESSNAKLVNDPFLLILGEAGIGKTHLVCDITKKRIENEMPPTVVVLGEKLLNIRDILKSITNASEVQISNSDFLEELNTKGKLQNQRSLIIVDAINEADRLGWKVRIKALIKRIRKYPWVGLVMTCRTPFENLLLPKDIKITTIYHEGFNENELEAMTAFFNFYNLELPQVPLLISEFSSPLFLSCFCKTASDMKSGKTKIAKQIKDIALGQVGMTKILEDFYINKGAQLGKKYGSKYQFLKNNKWIWGQFIKNAAKYMSQRGNIYLDKVDIIKVINESTDNKYKSRTLNFILKLLLGEGVIIRDLSWEGSTKSYFDVFKFPFNKFSDHIIARYLFKTYFDANNLKTSFSLGNPLGNLILNTSESIKNIDLIEALMVEFPERSKENNLLIDKDLVDFIPVKIRYNSEIRSAFINSMYWRKPSNFLGSNNKIKKSILRYINKGLLGYEDSTKELLDLFVATSTKPLHPFSAIMLSKYLKGFDLTNRDLFWSEYLRKQYGSGSVYKLIAWIENQNLAKITKDQASCVIRVLAWVLTTNVRLLRNRATKCIYILGKIQPEACYEVVLDLLDTNDPYITERLLAASYGVEMRLFFESKKSFNKLGIHFAKQIYRHFFSTKAKHATTNVVIRDYAKCIIELSVFHNPSLMSNDKLKIIKPPYVRGGIRRWGRSKDKDHKSYRNGNSPLGMDFENYTIGRLVKNRGNYDYKNKEFIKTRENIMWRIYKLGYTLEKFGKIDSEIASNTRIDRNSDYAGKIDRYGKKYSWIAYFELYGLKSDKGDLDDWQLSKANRLDEDSIDPSFPNTVVKSSKQMTDFDISTELNNLKKWLTQSKAPNITQYIKVDEVDGHKGPWTLVHGTIDKNHEKTERRMSTFITGLIIDKKKKTELKEIIEKTDFPGDHLIPSLPDVSDVFAGELGWYERTDDDLQRTFLEIPVGHKQIKLSRKEMRYRNISIVSYLENGDKEQSTVEIPKYRTETVYKKLYATPMARWFIGRNLSSVGADYDGLGLFIPSLEIMKENKLYMDCDLNIKNEKGEVVSIGHINGKQYDNCERLLYFRDDFLKNILGKTQKKLYIVAWGERHGWSKSGYVRDKHLDKIYQSYKNIHKQVIDPEEIKNKHMNS